MNHYEQAKQVLASADLIYSSGQVQQAIYDLAIQINQKFANVLQPVLVLPIMNGGLVLSGQLITRLSFPVEIDYIHATRYRNETIGSELQWKVKPQNSLENRTILIIDDILDEGHTLQNVVDFCQSQGAEQVCSVVLVEKNHDRLKAPIKSDFVGLTVEDRYVFGFGMDYKGYLRNLDAIYAVSEFS